MFYYDKILKDYENTYKFIGAAISFAGGLFDLATPLNRHFDAFWSFAMASEIGWCYDTIRNGVKKKRLGYSFRW